MNIFNDVLNTNYRNATPDVTPISDVNQCRAWLETLPITSVSEANLALHKQLIGLIKRSPINPIGYLEILETLLATITVIQQEYAKQFANKPLPLNLAASQAFYEVCRLWQTLNQAYEHLMLRGLDAEISLKPSLPLLCQRNLMCCLELIKEHFRAHRKIPVNLWSQLHGYYEIAEIRGFSDIDVVDYLHLGEKLTNCKATYAQALLLDMASPYSFPVREFEICCHWVKNWAGQLSITPFPESSRNTGYAVDLFSDRGPIYTRYITPSDSIRYLGLSSVWSKLLSYLKNLTQKKALVDPELGVNIVQPFYQDLLWYLHKQWKSNRGDRGFERNPLSCQAKVCTGFELIYHFINGTPFTQPQTESPYKWNGTDMSYMAKQFTPAIYEFKNSNIMLETEIWDVLDKSKTGFHARRSGVGARIAHDQLIAIRSPNGKHFFLCRVRRIRQDNHETIDLGLEILRGIPQLIAIRNPGVKGGRVQQYIPAFLLNANPASNTEFTLILPLNWYQNGRTIEVYYNGVAYITLNKLIFHGKDFDQVTFGPASCPSS